MAISDMTFSLNKEPPSFLTAREGVQSGDARGAGVCLHCAVPTRAPSEKFCCLGCEAIYSTLQGLGLSEFYRYRSIRPASAPAACAVEPLASSFAEFDLPEVIAQLAIPNESPYGGCQPGGEVLTVGLNLAGIHCAGCLWLLERLPQIIPGIIDARLRFSEAFLVVSFERTTISLAGVARALNSLGYPPQLPAPGASVRVAFGARQEQLILRIGVAGFCAANTMMLAVSLFEGLYTGIDDTFGGLFRFVSLLLTLPVMLYAAVPFYRSSLSALRLRRVHVDLPISIAILAVFALSCFNTAWGRPAVYFDSVCTLVFLLLLGRFVQLRAIARAQQSVPREFGLVPRLVTVIRNSCMGIPQREQLSSESIHTGDLIVTQPGERIAVDGVVREGRSSVDLSLLSGEPTPVPVSSGSAVWAGALNIEGEITIEAVSAGAQTRLSVLLRKMRSQDSPRAHIIALTDKLSLYFLWIVLAISAVTFVCWLPSSLEQAINSVVAFLIVSCPCALGLAAPAAFAIAAGRAARAGILVKNEEALERLAEVDEAYFDKTGTLTTGAFVVDVEHSTRQAEWSEYAPVIAALARTSSLHPVARAVAAHVQQVAPECGGVLLEDLRRVGGCGVMAKVAAGNHAQLGSRAWFRELGIEISTAQRAVLSQAENVGASLALFAIDNRLQAIFVLNDQLQVKAVETVSRLKEWHIATRIISGDNAAAVHRCARELGVLPEYARAELLPEQKELALKKASGSVLFAGDGLNDALAMRVASVSISMRGALEAALDVADIVVVDRGIEGVVLALDGARRMLSSVKRSLCVSACYNIVAGAAAVMGYINPFIAALVMPLSSATVLFLVLTSGAFVEQTSVRSVLRRE